VARPTVREARNREIVKTRPECKTLYFTGEGASWSQRIHLISRGGNCIVVRVLVTISKSRKVSALFRIM